MNIPRVKTRSYFKILKDVHECIIFSESGFYAGYIHPFFDLDFDFRDSRWSSPETEFSFSKSDFLVLENSRFMQNFRKLSKICETSAVWWFKTPLNSTFFLK